MYVKLIRFSILVVMSSVYTISSLFIGIVVFNIFNKIGLNNYSKTAFEFVMPLTAILLIQLYSVSTYEKWLNKLKVK